MAPFPIPTSAASRRASGNPSGSLLDRAPGLREGSERVATSIVKSLQKMAGTSTTIEGVPTGFTLVEIRDFVASQRADSVPALIECANLQQPLLAVADGTLVHAIVELMCGGTGSERPPTDARVASPIDQQFVQIVINLAAAAIQTEWTSFGFGAAKTKRIEGALSKDVCGPRLKDVGVVSISLGAFGLGGTLKLVLPPAALDRFAAPGSAVLDQSVEADPHWSPLLHRELGLAPLRVEAVIEAKPLPLKAIAELRTGQILVLPSDARSSVKLLSDGHALYRGEIGQIDNHYSVRIDDVTPDGMEPTATDLTHFSPSPLHETLKA